MNSEMKQILVIALTAAIAAVFANYFLGPTLAKKL
jgi:hypothetical protein